LNKAEIRKSNRDLVYKIIYSHELLSKHEISTLSGLSIPTVAQNLKDLKKLDLIDLDGVFESTGGRRAAMVNLNPDAYYSVGIDITKHHLNTVIVNMKGEIVMGGERKRLKYVHKASYYDTVKKSVTKLIENSGIAADKIVGMGVSLPSIVDYSNNRLTYSKVIEAPDNIIDEFKKRFSYPVSIYNDANSTGFAETYDKDETRLNEPVFCLMLSNSVGGAIITGDEVYKGINCRAGEIGHTKIVAGGKKCYCGQSGCANAYISSSILSDACEGNLKRFFAKLNSNDPECKKIFNDYLKYLAITITNIRMIFDCNIIIGGYAGDFMDDYMEELKKRLIKLNPYDENADFVRVSKYRGAASAVGAALVHMDNFIKAI